MDVRVPYLPQFGSEEQPNLTGKTTYQNPSKELSPNHPDFRYNLYLEFGAFYLTTLQYSYYTYRWNPSHSDPSPSPGIVCV